MGAKRSLTIYLVLFSLLVCSGVSAIGISTLLEGNEKFVNGTFTEEKEQFEQLLSGQNPHTLIISCSDSRSAPEMIFSSGPGELFVHRNIGNIVAPDDWSLATVLEYGIKHLGIDTIVVMGHEKCGAMKALGTGGVNGDSFVPGWLANSAPALSSLLARSEKPDSGEDLDSWLRELEKENIRLQLEHLKTNPDVSLGLHNGNLQIIGLYWNMTSGKVEQIG